MVKKNYRKKIQAQLYVNLAAETMSIDRLTLK